MSRRLTRGLLALLLFGALACAWSYPLVTRLGSALPGEFAGDNVAFLWNTWWARQVAAGFPAGFFFSPLLFAPFGFNLTLHTHTALQGAVSAWLLGGLSTLAAQNVIILLTLTLNGWCAYLLARDRTGDTPSAIVAGVIFAASPFVSAHLLGHFNLIGTWVLPAFLLCATRALRRGSRVWSALAGATLVAAAYTDYYLLVYAAVLGAALLLWRSGIVDLQVNPAPLTRRSVSVLGVLLAIAVAAVTAIVATGGFDTTIAGVRIRATDPVNAETFAWLLLLTGAWLRVRPRVRLRMREAWPVLRARAVLAAPALLVVLVGIAPLIAGAASLWAAGDYIAPTHFWRSGPAGIDVASLALGNPLHPVTGAWTTRMYVRLGIDRVESTGWLGIVPMLLVAAGIVRRRADARLRAPLLMAAFFFVWALGPWLTIAGHRTGVLLPANFLGFVPILSNARIPARAIVVAVLAMSMVAAYVTAALPARRRALWAGCATAFILIDCLPAPFPTIPLETPALYHTLAASPAGAIVELPLGLRDGFGQIGAFDDSTLLYQMTHGHPLVGGFAARIPESTKQRYRDMPIVRSLLRLSEPAGGEPDPRDAALTREEAGAQLRAIGVAFVVIDRTRVSAQLLAFLERQLPLTRLAGDGSREIFALAAN